jgi:hypothetical protein
MIQGIMAMGFSDTFKKATEQISGTVSNVGTFGGGSSSRTTMKRFAGAAQLGGPLGGSTFLAVAGPSATFATSHNPRAREKFLDKAKEFFRGKDERPPPVGAKPGQGAGNIAAKQQARARAIAAARGRFGIGDTIATSPLGLTGDGAALGKKRLIGE